MELLYEVQFIKLVLLSIQAGIESISTHNFMLAGFVQSDFILLVMISMYITAKLYIYIYIYIYILIIFQKKKINHPHDSVNN